MAEVEDFCVADGEAAAAGVDFDTELLVVVAAAVYVAVCAGLAAVLVDLAVPDWICLLSTN